MVVTEGWIRAGEAERVLRGDPPVPGCDGNVFIVEGWDAEVPLLFDPTEASDTSFRPEGDGVHRAEHSTQDDLREVARHAEQQGEVGHGGHWCGGDP